MLAGISSIMAPAFKLIDSIYTSDEERASAKQKLLTEKNQTTLKKLSISMSAILTEAKSRDKWTSRARPSFLYVMYLVIILCFIGGIIGVWYPIQVFQAAENIKALLDAVPDSLWMIFGTGYLGYGGLRSFDKYKIMKNRTEISNDS